MTPEPENDLIGGLLATLRNRWLLLVAMAVGGAAVGGMAVAIGADSVYRATAGIAIREPAVHLGQLHAPPGRSLVPLTDEGRVPPGETQLERAGQRLGIGSDQLSDAVEYVGSPSPRGTIGIEGENEDPERATEIANVVAEETVTRRIELDRGQVEVILERTREDLAGLSPRERGGQPGRLMRLALARLKAYASSTAGNAEFVQPAGVPAEGERASILPSAAAGALAGLLIAAGLALALERPRRKGGESAERE